MSAKSTNPILVTGAAGFIGARFVESCNRRGIPVISVDLPGTRERPEHRGLDFGTWVDRDALFFWLEVRRPALGAIVHLGACSDTSEQDEAYLQRVNVEYSQTLWTHAADRGVPFVYASSAATYGAGDQGYDDAEEKFPALRPLNKYGESKRRFDLWALDQERRGHQPPSWSGFKFFNVYGYGESHKQNMWSGIYRFYEEIQRTGGARLFKSHREGIPDGHQMRDFIFVDDVIDVLHFALSKPIRRGVFNLGTGKARTFLDVARAVFRSLGRPEKIEFVDTPPVIREHYQYFTEARMERLRSEGYARPFTELEDGARLYVERLRAANTDRPLSPRA